MAAGETAQISDLARKKLAQDRRAECRMQGSEADDIQRAFTDAMAKLGPRRQADKVIELAHLSRQRGEPAAQPRREVALKPGQQLDTDAIAQEVTTPVAAVAHETRADRIEIAQDFVPPRMQ